MQADCEILTSSTATLLDAKMDPTERIAEMFNEDINRIVEMVISETEDSDYKIELIQKTIGKLNNLRMAVDMNAQLMVLSSLFI